jgi:Fe-Mn family superoxide dismutase
MRFEVPPLPYPKDALAPHIGAETLEFHYEKHHKGYMKKLKGLIENTPLAAKDLEEIIETSDGADLQQRRAGLEPQLLLALHVTARRRRPAGEPPWRPRPCVRLARRLQEEGGPGAVNQFGSGYVWLYSQFDGRLAVRATHDAMNPLLDGVMPLFTIDLWEHGTTSTTTTSGSATSRPCSIT